MTGQLKIGTSTEAVDLTCVCERLADARVELDALKAKLSESEALLAKAVKVLEWIGRRSMILEADASSLRLHARMAIAELSSNTTGGKDD